MRTALRYSFAVLTVAIALVPTTLLAELLAPMRLFFLWFAVLVSALVAGTGVALLATGLALAGAYSSLFRADARALGGGGRARDAVRSVETEGRDRGSTFRVELPLDVHAVRDDTGHAFRYLPSRRHVEKTNR